MDGWMDGRMDGGMEGYVYVCACLHAGVHVCTYLCIYIYTHIHTYMHRIGRTPMSVQYVVLMRKMRKQTSLNVSMCTFSRPDHISENSSSRHILASFGPEIATRPSCRTSPCRREGNPPWVAIKKLKEPILASRTLTIQNPA